jgi:hypothetical protein
MKSIASISIAIIAGALVFSGCGKQEPAPAPRSVQPPAPPPPPAAPAPAVSVPANPAVPPAVAPKPAAAVTATATVSASAMATATATATVTGSTSAATLPETEISRGLKEALQKSVQVAIAQLGRENGFLNDASVKIPMPPSLAQVEKILRSMKQDAVADQFVQTMNHAAEQAVPAAATVFADAIAKMTVADARAILLGTENAATLYFRKACEPQLNEKLLPIVKDATAKVGVTSAYKSLLQKAGPAASFLGTDAGDLDAYVCHKSLDGLFAVMAREEAKIRSNPVARSTALLQQVFGAVSKPSAH